LSNTIVNVLIIGGIALVAWGLIGFPTTITDLKTDIENIKQEFAGAGPTPPTTTAAAPAADATGGDTGGGASGAGGGGHGGHGGGGAGGGGAGSQDQGADDSSDGSDQPDFGTNNGTAAPAPDLFPQAFAEPVTPVAPAPPAVDTTIPVLHKHHQQHPHVAVIHTPPHAVKKTHPPKHHKQKHGAYGHAGGGYKGTRGYYTKKGHHHCTRGTPGCVCTDKSKCKVGTNFAYAYYSGGFVYPESSAYSTLNSEY
jgi:hypothetical protein